MKFYKCQNCGSIALIFGKADQHCGKDMVEIIPGTVDAAKEKHIPVISQNASSVRVTVGEVAHPMLEEHSIEWIILETNQGFQKKDLKPGQAPTADFALAEGERVIAAYESCNLHGIWKAEA